ncbi:hypothetical protein Rhe02_65600 [Rhizocola hellebori]|uniref:Lipoprotein n=1 Tax=Rhizocola hellebori TaxID=1392758 RepID=A0A8J3QCS3_9ACTN|nr:hypothetical protein [Rhizocola hellebori]GIH08493.1 hypothetical protein Rhe02_65600 [Rhizocola hellebori]
MIKIDAIACLAVMAAGWQSLSTIGSCGLAFAAASKTQPAANGRGRPNSSGYAKERTSGTHKPAGNAFVMAKFA